MGISPSVAPAVSIDTDAAPPAGLAAATFHIVFNVNYGGLGGFGATLLSLVKHCSAPERLMLHIMCSKLAAHHKWDITAVLTQVGYRGRYCFIDYDADRAFGHLPRLHGDLTTYGRLLIAEYVDADRVLYLDSDLLVACDVLRLQQVDLAGHLLGAVTRSTVAHTLDQDYLHARGISKDTDYFNAGILLIDLARWRSSGVRQRWEAIVADEPEGLSCHDQTVLNRLCAGKFYRLPICYNAPFLAQREGPDHTWGIFHFLGSPKPWDMGGKQLHQGFTVWKANNPNFWQDRYQGFGIARLKRSWTIRRSILRTVMERYNAG